MKREGKARELTVGITLTLALVVFASLVLLLGREKRLFHAKHDYETTVSNSLGLKAGSPVVMGGVQIGTVTSVELPHDVGGSGIEVKMSVDRGYGDRIRIGSIASVGYITLLSGEKYIGISPGDPEKSILPDGALIPPDTSSTLLETGQNVAENLAKVTNDMRELLEGVNKGEGLIGRLLKDHDPYLGQQVLEGARTTIERMNTLVERVDKGEGTVGRLLSDRQYADDTLGSIKSAAARLDRVLDLVETKKGAAGELVQENGEGKQIIAELHTAVTSLKTTAGRLEANTGIVGRLLNDQDYSEQIARDLHTISSSLASIMEKIDKGEGSLGAFINDPSIAQGVQDIVGGIRRSKTAKFLLRHYGKKGAKEAAKEPPPRVVPNPDPGETPQVPNPQPEGGRSPDAPGSSGSPKSETPSDGSSHIEGPVTTTCEPPMLSSEPRPLVSIDSGEPTTSP